MRTMLLNPRYYMPLITGGGTGMNAYAARIQNMYGALTVSNNKLSKQMGDQLSNELLGMSGYINGATASAGYQSSLAWMIYLSEQGTWAADASTVQKLVDEYMRQVIEYGVACCHHTCKNLAFNARLIQMSSLTPAQKAKFAENGTSNDESSQDGGKTAFGLDASESGDAKSASVDSASSSASSESVGNSGAKAYELSEKSAAKSVSATESSMPIFVIIAVMVLIAIFLVGYVRNDDDEYDDY